MPITFLFFTIGACSNIGQPPYGGMWSKWYLAMGTIEAGQWALLAVLMVSSLLNIVYLLAIHARAFLIEPKATDNQSYGEAPLTCLIAMSLTSLMCIVLFFNPQPFYSLARMLVMQEP